MDIYVVSMQFGTMTACTHIAAPSEYIARTIASMRYPLSKIVEIKAMKDSPQKNVILVDFRAKRRLV